MINTPKHTEHNKTDHLLRLQILVEVSWTLLHAEYFKLVYIFRRVHVECSLQCRP